MIVSVIAASARFVVTRLQLPVNCLFGAARTLAPLGDGFAFSFFCLILGNYDPCYGPNSETMILGPSDPGRRACRGASGETRR